MASPGLSKKVARQTYEAVPSIGALARGLMEERLDVLGGAPE